MRDLGHDLRTHLMWSMAVQRNGWTTPKEVVINKLRKVTRVMIWKIVLVIAVQGGEEVVLRDETHSLGLKGTADA